MSKKIIAIGGGENGRDGYPYETKEIDLEIVKQSGLKNPHFLFIGLAIGKFAESYFTVMSGTFSKLGCIPDMLRLNEIGDIETVKNKISKADIIYVGGGNTLKLMTLLRKYKIDSLLKNAYERGVVMCGLSAGGICWCDFGNSDSRKFTSNSNQLIKVRGLGLINILFCPHYNIETHRQDDLKRMMKRVSGVPAVALDNGVALEVVDNSFRFVKSISGAEARKFYWFRGEYIERKLVISSEFRPINELYSKE